MTEPKDPQWRRRRRRLDEVDIEDGGELNLELTSDFIKIQSGQVRNFRLLGWSFNRVLRRRSGVLVPLQRSAAPLVEPEGDLFAFAKLTIDADIIDTTPAGVARFLYTLDAVYRSCFRMYSIRFSGPFNNDEQLRIGYLRMASPAHIIGAGDLGKIGSGAKSAADAIETVATLGAKRKIARADADVAQGTVDARIASENASARKAIAEADSAEQKAFQDRVATLRESLQLATDIGDQETIDRIRIAIKGLFGAQSEANPEGVRAVAASTNALVGQARAIGASFEEIEEGQP